MDPELELELAIVGAGVAGLGAAYALSGAGAETGTEGETGVGVTVYERREAPGGRAATRRREGCVYDAGANYLTPEDPEVNRLVRDLGTGDPVDVSEPVWPFDRTGEIEPEAGGDEGKWTYREGIAALGERLLAAADVECRRGTAVEAICREKSDDEWLIEAADGTEAYDAVLCTPPGPVTADLLAGAAGSGNADGSDGAPGESGSGGGSDGGESSVDALAAAAAAVPYRHVATVALHYPERLERPWYALVNADHEHAVGWVSREECKPGHVPEGESLLIAQMGPEWSADRAKTDPDALVDEAAGRVAALLETERLADPDWTDLVRWPHALADDAVDPQTVAGAAERSLFVAGDWVVDGPSRLHSALRSGLDAAAAIADSAD